MRVITFLSVLAATSMAALAQTNTPLQFRPMSLEDCITVALEQNFDIQYVRYNPLIARYTLAGSYGAYEPGLSLSGQHDYSLSPGGVDSEGRIYTGSEMDANTVSAGLGGLLPWGTRYNLGGSASDRWGTTPALVMDRNTPVGFTTNYFTDLNGNQIGLISTNYAVFLDRVPFENGSAQAGFVQLSQPLLKNFWIDAARYQIFASKKNVKIREEEFRLQIMDTITRVEKAYFGLVYTEDSVKVQEKALELAERLLAENKKRVEVGAMAPLDEKQAESQAATSRAALLDAVANRNTAMRYLKELLSDDYTNEWANVAVVPTDRLLAIGQQYDLQESWRKGLAQNPGLVAKRLGLDTAKYNIRFQRNQLFPQLDLVGAYGFSGSGSEFSDTLGQVRRRDNPSWSFGAQVSIPLGQTAARNNLKAAKAAKEQLDVDLRRAEQLLLITIENDIGAAKASFEQVDATRQARLYAEAALEAEQKKLENGKSTSFVVLQLQRDLTTARANEIKALADYNISLAQLAFDEGSTMERRNVALDLRTLGTEKLDWK
jgi:outer membrane protein TolC